MAVTGFIHHIGTFLLLVATALLIVTDISSPVVRNIAILKVNLGNATGAHNTAVTFGTFGHCILDVDSDNASDNIDYCTGSIVGYNPANYMREVDGTAFSQYSEDTTRVLTKVMILHPIATAVTFIAFMLTLGAGVVGSLLASLVALGAFLITAVALICDFVLFSIIRSNVNDNSTDSDAHYSTGMWTLLAAAILLLLATIVVFFSCCSGRMHRKRERRSAVPKGPVVEGYGEPVRTHRRRRWF